MSLSKYKEKRSFNKTPEPEGGKASNEKLEFVIQKHAASRLHYDFRLEMNGVLKSWAVPKGPSTDPSVKRLAMMVEDHPYDYKNFEGIIPKGNYGAGTVIVWDHGTYEPLEKTAGKKESEKLLLKQLHQGSIKIKLKGKKLKGEFALVRTKRGDEENAWLLIKHRDDYATTNDITLKDKSVLSGKTIEKIAATSKNVYGEDEKAEMKTKKKTAPDPEKEIKKELKAAKPVSSPGKARPDLKGTPKAPFPSKVTPMLATLVDKPFDEPGWLYEIKWDGYRALAMCNKKSIELVSRNNKTFNEKFYPVYEAVKQWGINAVVDGEIAVLNDTGVSHFGSLQNWRSEADGELVYYVFDLLWLNGRDLRNLPLTRRRELLATLVPEEGIIRLSENFETSATEFIEAAKKIGLEGVIAKKADSIYIYGSRTLDWLKIKANQRQEVVIGGFTKNTGSSKTFSSLLVGVFEKGKLHYTGKIGTGFTVKLQQELKKKFEPLITDEIPFVEEPDVNKPSRFRPNPPKAAATWLRPELVCEVSYAEITADGVMRHPSFEGMREDKNAKDVKREIPEKTAEIIQDDAEPVKKEKQASPLLKSSGKKTRKTLLNPTNDTQIRNINGQDLKFTNLSKIYWPKEKYTKRELINYYYQVAPYILPYLENRPQSLNRYVNGIEGKNFYQKDVTGSTPDWIELLPYHTSDELDKNFLVCTNEASLLYMANLGCIEMHPWNSTIEKPDHPDWCIIDLDPSDKNTFDQVIEAAKATKKVLDSLKVPGYCKTSGSTGMHIYIPLNARYTYDDCQLFAKWIASMVQQQLPAFTSIERMTDKRRGKLYIDYLQNRPQATLAAPYSVRPKPGATVSMPLHWEEVKKGLKIQSFTIKNAMDRIKSEGDIFKPVLGEGIDLMETLKLISK
jgi:bifunctional non-homologous end joining protein LigD